MKKRTFKKISLLASLLLVFQFEAPLTSAFADTVATASSVLPPSNLGYQLQTPDDVKLTWSSVYQATGYNIYEIQNGQLTLVGSTTSTSYTLNNLTQGSHSYVVSTLSAGGESGPCAPITVNIVYPQMAAPATLTNTIQNGNDIVLSWSASQYAEHYNVYQIADDGSQTLVTSVTGKTTYTMTNSPAGTFTYAVSAVNSLYGESPLSTSVQVAVVYPTMAAPANLKYSITNGNTVNLSWSSVAYATNYKLYQVVNGQETLVSTVTGTSIALSNQPAGDYTYVVHSYSDRFGESADSAPVSLTVSTVTMAPPGNFAYSIKNGNDISLTWSSVQYATNYKVYQIVDGQPVLKSTVTGTSVTFTNQPAGDYTYVVHSYSSTFGESADSAPVSFTMNPVTMAPPGNFACSIKNINDISLTWSSVPYATNYKVYQIVNGQPVLKSTLTGTSVTYSNQPAGDYTYVVHSYSDRFGESDDSASVTATIDTVTMAAPTNLADKIQNGNDIVLTWDAAANATSYNVYQIINGQRVLKSTVSGTTVTYSNMAAGDYTYEVHSVSSRFGESTDGSQVSLSLVLPTMQPPANVVQTIKDATDFSLHWDPAAYATSYKVYQIINGQKVLKATVTSTTAAFSNMTPGDYTYEVHSVSTRFGESLDGTELTFTLNGQTMAPPTNLTYSVTNGNDITLRWTAAPYATSYKIYQIVNGQPVLKSTVTGTAVTFTNQPAGDYDYVVDSVSSLLGESPTGAETTFSLVYPVMAAPSNLAYKIQNGNNVVLTWGSVPYATSYKVYEVVNGQEVLVTTTTSLSATITNVPAGDHTYVVHSSSTRFGDSNGAQLAVTVNQVTMQPPGNLTQTVANGNDIVLKWNSSTYATSYKVYQVIDGQEVLKSTVTGTSVTYTNQPGGDYTFVVHSYSSTFGESADSSPVSFTLVLPTMQDPGSLVQSITNGNDITLRWSAATYATSYKVYQIVNGQKVLKSTVTGTAVTYTNQPAGDYTFVVDAVSTRFGESAPGSTVSFTLVWPVVQPPALSGSIVNANNITLTWKSVQWANEYRVYDVTSGTPQLIYKGTALTYKIYNLSEATHSYEVTAYNTRFGESAPSDVLSEDIVYPVMQAPVASVQVLSPTSAQISWTFAAYANGYNVYEVTNGTPVLLVKDLNNLSYTVSDLSHENHLYYVTSYSNSFGESQPSNTVLAKLILDTTPPVTTANAPTGWVNQSAVVTLSATDDDSGVANTYYSVNGSAYAEGTSFTVDQEGDNKVSFYSVDKEGNKEQPQTIDVNIDKTAPVTEVSPIPAWADQPLNVTLSATDTGSGVAHTYYSINGSDYVEGTSFTVGQEGDNKVSFYSVDQAGNKEAVQAVDVKVDSTPPVTSSDAPTGWSNKDVTVTLSATDTGSGVAHTYYSVNGSDYVEGTSFTVSQDGDNQISFYSVDEVGNKEAVQTVDVKVDKTPPVTSSDAPTGWSNKDVTVTLHATDAGSGVASTDYAVDGATDTEGTSFTIGTEGIHTVTYYSVDVAGNREAEHTVQVKIDKTAPVITMNLNSEYALGKPFQLSYSALDNLSGVASQTMTVTGPGTPSGTVIGNGNTFTPNQPGTYTVSVTVTDAAGNTTTIQKQFVVYIPATIEITPNVIKGNSGVFTARVSLPSGYSTQGFDLNTVTLNGVEALNSNNGYYNQAKNGQFKFERSAFSWNTSTVTLEFRGYVNGYLVVGQVTVNVQQ